MRNFIFAAVLCVVITPAYAQVNSSPTNNTINSNISTPRNTNNTSTNSQTNTNRATSTSGSTNDNDNRDSNTNIDTNDIDIAGDEIHNPDIPVSGAGSVGLYATVDTCMGSSGLGAQGMMFGFTIGTTWTDEHCQTLKAGRELRDAGYQKASKARYCMDDKMREAFRLVNQSCPQDRIEKPQVSSTE